jgi:hypothetical protein
VVSVRALHVRKGVAAGAVAATVAAACNSVIGLHEPIELAPDAGDDAAIVDGSTADGPRREGGAFTDARNDGSSDEGLVPCPPGATVCDDFCTLIDSDPQNCGSCHRDCLGGACIGGLCEVQVATQGEPVRGVVGPQQLLWMTDRAVFSAQPSIFGVQSPTRVFTTDGGPLRSIAPPPAGWPWLAILAVAPGDDILMVTEDGGAFSLVADAGDPVGLAASHDWLYWSSSDPSAAAILGVSGFAPVVTPVAALAPNDDACSLAAGSFGVTWTSSRGTFVAAPDGGVLRQITANAFDFAVAAGDGYVVVSENDGKFDLTLYDLAQPLKKVLVVGAYAKAVAIDTADGGLVYYASNGIYATSKDGLSGPRLVAPGTVADGCRVPVLAVVGNYVFWVDRDTNQLVYVAQ